MSGKAKIKNKVPHLKFIIVKTKTIIRIGKSDS
jgi:hypothetical protein